MNQTISQESSSYYLSLPYSSFDCYDLIKLFYRREFNIDMAEQDYLSPSMLDYSTAIKTRDTYKRLVELAQENEFYEIDSPQYGDVLLFRSFGIPAHVGIYIGDNLFLHTQKRSGACFEKIASWNNRLIGYYRHVDKTKTQST